MCAARRWISSAGRASGGSSAQLRADYEKLLDEIAAKLTPENYESAVALAALPEKIRGFGHVKLQSVEAAKAEETALLARFRAESLPQPIKLAAE